MQTEMVVGDDNGHREHHCSCPSLTTPMSARYVYAGIFFLANIVAWVERENPITYFRGQRLISGCEGNRDCLAAEAVLIISLALFVSSFFFSKQTFGFHQLVLALTKFPAFFLYNVLLHRGHEDGTRPSELVAVPVVVVKGPPLVSLPRDLSRIYTNRCDSTLWLVTDFMPTYLTTCNKLENPPLADMVFLSDLFSGKAAHFGAGYL